MLIYILYIYILLINYVYNVIIYITFNILVEHHSFTIRYCRGFSNSKNSINRILWVEDITCRRFENSVNRLFDRTPNITD